jgi:hypothetical protein
MRSEPCGSRVLLAAPHNRGPDALRRRERSPHLRRHPHARTLAQRATPRRSGASSHHPTRRVVTSDFLGWGVSDRPAAYRATDRNKFHEVETVINELGLDDIVLVVHHASGSATMPPAPGIDGASLSRSRGSTRAA